MPLYIACGDTTGAWPTGDYSPSLRSPWLAAIEIVGSSSVGIDDAIRNGVERAAKTLKYLNWFQVVETRGHIRDGKVGHFQVVLKLGFRLEDAP